MWQKITGTIIYDHDWDWYAYCKLPKSLGFYLRHLAWMNKKSLRLMQPEGGTHITFIKRERPPNVELWGKYHNQKCSIYYNIEVGNNKDAYYWLSINPIFLYDIRKELGLPHKPRYPLHLSYGIDKDYIERRHKLYGTSSKKLNRRLR